jgi:uncharacterized membrane protein
VKENTAMQNPYGYRAHIKAAECMRAEAQGQLLLKAASAVTPSRSTMKGLGVACVLAAGAFVLTMVKNPPKSVASDPTAPIAKAGDVQVPTGIPAGDCLTASVCP